MISVPSPQSHSSTSRLSQDSTLLHQNALQVSDHLHTLLCIINQQMTTIASLQSEVNAIRDNPKTMYRHNDQLEELRNLQDKMQEEKTIWMKQKEIQEKELDERRDEQEALAKQIRVEQEDIRQQREQLFRKMEKLTSQGVILSPNVSIPSVVSGGNNLSDDSSLYHNSSAEEYHIDGTLSGDRRKDKWRSSSSKFFFFFFFN